MKLGIAVKSMKFLLEALYAFNIQLSGKTSLHLTSRGPSVFLLHWSRSLVATNTHLLHRGMRHQVVSNSMQSVFLVFVLPEDDA